MDYWWPCLATSLAATESAAAEEPESTPDEALAQLAIAGAPLIGAPAGPAAQATDKTSLSTTPALPAQPGLTLVSTAPSSQVAPQVAPQVGTQIPPIPDPTDLIPDPKDLLPNLDPKKWAGDILNAVLNEIGKALLEAMRGFIDWALGFGDSSLNFVTQTPAADTYESTTDRSLWDFSRAIVNVGLAVILAALLNSREVWARSTFLAFDMAVNDQGRSAFD